MIWSLVVLLPHHLETFIVTAVTGNVSRFGGHCPVLISPFERVYCYSSSNTLESSSQLSMDIKNRHQELDYLVSEVNYLKISDYSKCSSNGPNKIIIIVITE